MREVAREMCKMWSMLPTMASAIAPCWVKPLDFAIFCEGYFAVAVDELTVIERRGSLGPYKRSAWLVSPIDLQPSRQILLPSRVA